MKPFTKLLIMIATLANVGCGSEGFTPHEKEVIAAGEVDIMALTTIANEQDSILLRSKSEPLTREMVESKEFEVLCRRMLATVQDPLNEGVGIAAPQVGLLRRLVAVQRFDKEGEPFEFFVNPEIVELGDDVELGGEGCLSVPEIRGEVRRAQSLVLRYRDAAFEERTERVEGFTAVIFQHEIDHLDGVLFIDKMEAEIEAEEDDETDAEE
ncbi:MAG: peptide deformylase [Rikenellaceae bacterium]|nr:peptide deformylase [Rikenellaceae bacterium]